MKTFLTILISVLLTSGVIFATTYSIRPDTASLTDNEKVIVETQEVITEFKVIATIEDYEGDLDSIIRKITNLNAEADKWNPVYSDEGVDHTFKKYRLVEDK